MVTSIVTVVAGVGGDGWRHQRCTVENLGRGLPDIAVIDDTGGGLV